MSLDRSRTGLFDRALLAWCEAFRLLTRLLLLARRRGSTRCIFADRFRCSFLGLATRNYRYSFGLVLFPTRSESR